MDVQSNVEICVWMNIEVFIYRFVFYGDKGDAHVKFIFENKCKEEILVGLVKHMDRCCEYEY